MIEMNNLKNKKMKKEIEKFVKTIVAINIAEGVDVHNTKFKLCLLENIYNEFGVIPTQRTINKMLKK